jgi:hypothetical protein
MRHAPGLGTLLRALLPPLLLIVAVLGFDPRRLGHAHRGGGDRRGRRRGAGPDRAAS